MKRRLRVPQIRPKRHAKSIKFTADRQIVWQKYVPTLKNFRIESVELRSISGDAPKDFVIDREYRPGYRSRQRPNDQFIAKVGSKYYPLESIVEEFVTRIGKCFDLKIADSKLRIIDGQVRFMSKYFLKAGEQLTHGAELYEICLGKTNYAELADAKKEREFFTFEMTCEAIRTSFPDFSDSIIRDYVEMLAFDALIGHNDRHPYNWGVIVPLKRSLPPRFSPVFDTARALFWNLPERRVVLMLADSSRLEKYISECRAPICWSAKEVDFFQLIGLIWRDHPFCRGAIEKFLIEDKLEKVSVILNQEFKDLMSKERRELVEHCLHQRQKKLIEAVKSAAEGL